MGGYRLAGALWLMAGFTCAGLFIFVFVGENREDLGVLLRDPALPALVLSGTIVGLLTGGLLIRRPGPGVVRWSTIIGIAWLIGFGSLAFSALGGPEPGPVVSSSLITGFGIAGALVAYSSRGAGRAR